MSPAVARILRGQGIDAIGAHEAVADGIRGVLEPYPDGLTGLVIYVGRHAPENP